MKCCNKDMIKVGVVDMLNNNTLLIERWVCGECGVFYDEHRYTLDDEELINELKHYDELKDTPIYKQLIEDEE